MQNTSYMILIQQGTTVVNAPMPEKISLSGSADYSTTLPQGLVKDKGFIDKFSSLFGTKFTSPALTAQLWQGSSSHDIMIDLEFHTETDPVSDVRVPIVNLMKMATPSVSAQGMLQSPGPSLNLSGLGQIASSAGTQLSNTFSSIGTSISNALSGNTSSTAATMNNTNTSTNDGTNVNVPAPNQQNPNLGTSAYWKSQVTNPIVIQFGNYLYFDSVVITSVQITESSNFDATTNLPHHATVQVAFKPLFMLVQSDIDSIFLGPAGSNATSPNSNTGASLGPNETLLNI